MNILNRNKRAGINCLNESFKLHYLKPAYNTVNHSLFLTGKTADDFSKIYYDMEMKKFKAAHEVYRKAKQVRRSETPVSDADYLKSAEEQAMVPVKTAEIEYQFFGQIKDLLSPEQLFLYYHWERRFGKEMIRREQKK